MVDYQSSDNPYVPGTVDLEPQTQPLDVVIRDAIDAALMTKVNVWRPAAVTKVIGEQRVNIQIQLRAQYNGSAPFVLPQIQNVMVWNPLAKLFRFKLPISVGDTGMALFCDRSLDVWSNGDGGPVTTGDSRAHQLTDAVFIPGLVPFSKQTTDGTNDVVLGNGDDSAQVRIRQAADGSKILLGGKDSISPAVLGDVLINGMDALFSKLDDLITAISAITVSGVTTGPGVSGPPVNAAAITAIAAQIDTIKSTYFDTAGTNIASQQTFLKRGG